MGRGLAGALCEQAEQFASKFGEQKMSADIMAESQAVEFWQSLGYTIEEEWITAIIRCTAFLRISEFLYRSESITSG